MRVIPPDQFRPAVRIANHHPAPRGQEWGPRTIPDLQFICPLRGRFAVRDATGEVVAAPGQILCIQPNRWHTVALMPGEPDGEMAGMHLELVSNGRWAAGDYRSDPLPPPVSTPADPAAVREAFLRAARAFNGYGRLRASRLSAIAWEALLLLAESWTTAPTARSGGKVAAMVAHIRQHAVRGVDRHELAHEFDVTPEHVNALIKRELGLTPRDVLNQERCRIAYRLIHDEGLPVVEAATRSGYLDPFYFSRVFKAIYGMPPSRVR